MTIKEWGSLGISFTSGLRFNSTLGSINLTGPVVFNNVAYYQANNLQQVQSNITRPWLRVKTDGVTNYQWNYWRNITDSNWNKVLYISSSARYGINPSDVYKAYIGTNKFIIDDNEGLTINPDNLNVYSEISWSANVATPV